METLDMLAGDGGEFLIGYEQLETLVGSSKAAEIAEQFAERGFKPRKAGVVYQGGYRGLKTRFVGVEKADNLAAAATHTARITATNPFNAERFVIPRTIAESLVITEWRIGDKTVLWSPGDSAPLPCDMFAADSATNQVSLDTITETRGMSITFENVSAAAVDFFGGFIGTGATT